MPPLKGLSVKFWGVRGSFPTPAASHLRYGGNTSCVEVRAGNGTRFIIDAGTGLRGLGLEMEAESSRGEIHFLLTHFHGDHMHGLPFFTPLYDKRRKITFYSGQSDDLSRWAVHRLMSPPFFPVDLASMPGERRFVTLWHQPKTIAGVQVTCFPLNHPQHAWGVRIEYEGSSFVHASDYEHGNEVLEAKLLQAARGADLLLYDAQYTPEEYKKRKGWGHSTWAQGIRVAKKAGAKRLVLFHHDPSHDDAAMDLIVEKARLKFPNVEAAREGAAIELLA